jgi:hypothetical protein
MRRLYLIRNILFDVNGHQLSVFKSNCKRKRMLEFSWRGDIQKYINKYERMRRKEKW